jgi:hypothetical protein
VPPEPVVAPRPPKLGPAADQPDVAPKNAAIRRRSGLGSAIAWTLGIGVGALAAGAFIGFLVNGPPGRALPTHTLAETAPPSTAPPSPASAPIAAPAPAKPIDTRQAAVAPTAPAAPAPAPPRVEEKKVEAAPAPAESAPSAAPPSQLAAAEVREVQGRLRALGFNPGPVDGTAGPQTMAAVKQYQQSRGLGATGTADKDVLARLRQEQQSPPQQAQAPPPPPAPQPRAHRYAAAPPPPPPPRRESFLESLDRLFRR